MQINKVVTHIDVDSNRVMITLEDGTKLYFYHYQDCCEHVYIYDWKGDPHQLVGKKLLMIDENNNDFTDEVNYDPDESYTCTNFRFITNEDTIISRWIGESNGYYSESVTLDILAPKVE
jgi:archaellin